MRPLSFLKVPLLFCLIIEIQVVSSFVAFGQERDGMRVAFWNFENFFDPFADSTRVYNEFTENGGQHWTKSRFYKKRNNLYKAILAISENEPLAILGIAEVENEYVLKMLFNQTPLQTHNYRIVHYEGDDKRGIDVAMVYCIGRRVGLFIVAVVYQFRFTETLAQELLMPRRDGCDDCSLT